MIMTESPKQFKDYCGSCKKDLCNGERAILTRNMKFYHFYCYKKKCFIYRFFNPIQSFFIWEEACYVVEELNNTFKKYNSSKKEGELEDAVAEGDFTNEVHELRIATSVEMEKCNFEGSLDGIDEVDEKGKSRIDMIELTENLMQIMDEIGDMKAQINVFSAEKENDEKIIKHLELLIVKYKKENMELKWKNNYLHEKLLAESSKLRN